ncbi:MAG: TRAP transporter small permease [Peptococcaceae bacterium]|nr:TRAP transporter small permease [Peptococcaceae bacterium]
MERFKRAYAAFEDYLAGSLLFLGLTLIMINIVLRYFFGRPQSILDEFSIYFVVWGILLGLGVALRNDHHIKVDMLYNLLPLRVKWLVSIFSNSLGLAFCFLYTFYGFKLVNSYVVSGQRSTDSQFPLWIVNLVIPVSGVMFGVRFLEKIYQITKNGGRDWLARMEKGGYSGGDGSAL